MLKLAKLDHQTMFAILVALFVTCLVVADTIGSKLIQIGPLQLALPGQVKLLTPSYLLSAGIIPFPVTFLLTDLVNEFYGPKGAKTMTLIGLAMAILTFCLYGLACVIPAIPNSPLSQPIFLQVFGQSQHMFLASMVAYLFGQFIDIYIFFLLRKLTKEKLLWLRATGSTVASQMIDSIVVASIAFYPKIISGLLSFNEVLSVAVNNYGIKFLIAVGLTPFCYLGHSLIHKMLKGDVHQKIF